MSLRDPIMDWDMCQYYYQHFHHWCTGAFIIMEMKMFQQKGK